MYNTSGSHTCTALCVMPDVAGASKQQWMRRASWQQCSYSTEGVARNRCDRSCQQLCSVHVLDVLLKQSRRSNQQQNMNHASSEMWEGSTGRSGLDHVSVLTYALQHLARAQSRQSMPFIKIGFYVWIRSHETHLCPHLLTAWHHLSCGMLCPAL
jgi:hypothetical protein